jgi:CRP/FNR family transcriptional regulator, nitrogen oxide reductase regulator
MAIELDAQLIDRLRGAPFFQGLEPEAMEAAGRTATLQRAGRGSYFFHQGEAANTLYVLTSGRVKLSQVTPEGDEVLLRFEGPGELFGGVGTLAHTAYPASAQAVEDSEALAWDTASVRALMERQPRLALNALEMLAERLRELQDRYRELATQRVEQRLAHAVLRLAMQCGRALPGGILLDVRLSREDLANMTGTTLYTVSRILSRWEQEGLVKSRRERVLLRDPEGLTEIAEDRREDPAT